MVIEDGVLAGRWREMGLPGRPACPSELLVVSRPGLLDLVKGARDTVFVFNALNHVPLRRYLDPSCTLITDFLADLRLEHAARYVPPRQRLITKYRRYRWGRAYRLSISDADIVLANGRNKLAVIQHEARNIRHTRIPQIFEVPFSVDCDALLPPAAVPRRPHGSSLRIFVGGYLQPWQRLGRWPAAVKRLFLDSAVSNRLTCRIHLVPKGNHADLGQFMALDEYSNATVTKTTIPLSKYLAELYASDIVLDLHQSTIERKFAMPTRAVIAICAGRPVIHQDRTELSHLLREYGAGFLVDPDDEGQIEALLLRLLNEPETLSAARAGAERLRSAVLNPSAAIDRLVRHLRKRR